MIFLALLFFLSSLSMYSANIDSLFVCLKKSIEECPINCKNPACAQKCKTTLDKNYSDVYTTYHVLTEFTGQQYGLDPDFRFFMNGYGEILICKKDASIKKDLLLFKRCTDVEEREKSEIERALRNVFHKKNTKKLDTFSVPAFQLVQSADYDPKSDYLDQRDLCYCKPSCSEGNIDYERPCGTNLNVDFLCCAKLMPSEIINIISNMMFAINPRVVYLYTFLDVTRKNSYYNQSKKYLFSLVDITHLTTAFHHWQKKFDEGKGKKPELHFATADYRYFLVDHPFTVMNLYANIDFFGNGGKRIAMLCQQEENIKYWFSSEIKKSFMIMHIPRRREKRHCVENRCRSDFLGVKLYPIDQIKKNHDALANKDTYQERDELPLNCYRAQIITGPEQELREYFAVALKRIALRTSCLAKNDAATNNNCEVFNNVFGQFVVKRDGKPTVLNGRLILGRYTYNHYYAVHAHEDVFDDTKMLTQAQRHAQAWKKTSDGRFLYCWEENLHPTCTKVYPYGVECGWEGKWCGDKRYDGFCSLYEYSQKDDIHFRGEGLASFGRYRLWIVPTQKHEFKNDKEVAGIIKSCYEEKNVSCFEDKECSKLPFYVAYADWPYEVTSVSNDTLILEHGRSDFKLKIEIPDLKQKYCTTISGIYLLSYWAEVIFDDQERSYDDNSGRGKIVHLIRMFYTYKEQAKKLEFDQRKKDRDGQKIYEQEEEKREKDKNEKIDTKQKNIFSLPQFSPRKTNTQGISLLKKSLPIIFGGIAVCGLWWFLHKQPAVDTKVPAPTV